MPINQQQDADYEQPTLQAGGKDVGATPGRTNNAPGKGQQGMRDVNNPDKSGKTGCGC
jgi:hypothetical protein